MAKRRVVYQEHHPDRERRPDYTIRLRKWLHLVITRIQRMNPTEENYRDLVEFRHALDEEIWRVGTGALKS